jgi:hypothetical protein
MTCHGLLNHLSSYMHSIPRDPGVIFILSLSCGVSCFVVLVFCALSFPNPKSVIMFRIVSSAVVWCIITVNQCHPGLGIRRLR